MSDSGDKKNSADPGIARTMRELAKKTPLDLEPAQATHYEPAAVVATFLTSPEGSSLSTSRNENEREPQKLIEDWVDFCAKRGDEKVNITKLGELLDTDCFYTLNEGQFEKRYLSEPEPKSQQSFEDWGQNKETKIKSWDDFDKVFGPQPTKQDVEIEEQGSDPRILFSMGPQMVTILWNRLVSDKDDSSQGPNRWAVIARKQDDSPWKLTFVSRYCRAVPSVGGSDRAEIKKLISRWQEIPFSEKWKDGQKPPHKMATELENLFIGKKGYAIADTSAYPINKKECRERLLGDDNVWKAVKKHIAPSETFPSFDRFHICPIDSCNQRHAVVAFSQTVPRKDKGPSNRQIAGEHYTLCNTMILKEEEDRSWKIRMFSQAAPIPSESNDSR